MQDTYEIIRKHKWKIALSFILAAFIIFAITFLVGLSDILNVLRRTNLEFLILNFILELAILVTWTLRWKLILNVVDKAPNFKTLFFMLLASLFGNNITPGAAGGEPLRAYLLREVEGTPFEIGFASSTADRVFEFFPFALISLFAAILILTWEISIWTRIIVSVLIFLAMVFFGILLYAGLKKEIAQRIIISLARSVYPFFVKLTRNPISFLDIKDKLIFYVNRFSTGFVHVLKDRKVFIFGFILSFGMWGLDMVRIYVCFMAVGSYPPILPLVIIYTVAILISFLPILPGSWGIREATMVALFAVVGVSADVVIAASLIDRLASYIFPTFVGAIVALYYGKQIRKGKMVIPNSL
ncbi:MAG: UPF0104 family protein [Euryarchaeota archaeon]|nr:UPF0104 family protein [Euryarchaeota archaeon]